MIARAIHGHSIHSGPLRARGGADGRLDDFDAPPAERAVADSRHMYTRLDVDYWTIDSDGELAAAEPLTDATEDVAASPNAADSLLTIRTPPCESVAGLRRALAARLTDVLGAAERLDRRLVPLATPINGTAFDAQAAIRGGDRSNQMPSSDSTSTPDLNPNQNPNSNSDSNSKSNLTAEPTGSVGLDCAAVCAGARIHVEQRAVVDQLNALVALAPALALVNSSPYLRGERVANGARTYCYREQGVSDGGRHWTYVDDVAEWRARLERQSERIKDAVLASGGDPTAIDDATLASAGWTPAELHGADEDEGAGENESEAVDADVDAAENEGQNANAPATIAWRTPDTALPSQLLQLTADIETVMNRLDRGLVQVGRYADTGTRGDDGDVITVGHVTNDEIALPKAEVVAELTETAMDVGLDATAVASYLERMGFAVSEYHPISSRIDGRQYVTRSDARELRLEYAGRLEEDVAALATFR